MSDAPACPSRYVLEKFLAGTLDAASDDARHLATCPLCAENLRALQAEGAAYMMSDHSRALRQRLAAAPAPRARWWRWAVPIAVAACVALIWWRAREPGHEFVAMGSPTVQLLVQRAGVTAPYDRAPLRSGDVLQLSWTSARPAFVAVIGRQRDAEVIAWFPTTDSAAETRAGTVALGDALRFDPPFSGTVNVFVSEHSFAVAPLLEALRAGRAPAFDGTVSQLEVPQAP